MKLLKVLHVGVANRGVWPLDKCGPGTGFVSAALCDVSPAALAAARERTGLTETACYSDLGAALKSTDVDCVIACVPTVYHAPVAKQCMAAGKAVLIEKGMAPDWATAKSLVATATESGGTLCVAQNYRYQAAERTVRRALTDPTSPAYLGAVHLVTYTHHRVRPEPRTLNYPFASVWDMSCHHFDTMLDWLGPVTSMSADAWGATWSNYAHPNNTSGHLRFANGTRVHYLHTHDAARGSLDVQLHGERGALVWTDAGVTFSDRPTEMFGTRPVVPVPLEPPGEGGAEADLLRDFHAYIEHGREPGISGRRNLETMAVCEMMVRSVREGRTVTREEL